ncbi:PREDICTED: F-box/kelch-repeat protein At3g06240-like [Fragaria vesca subsp. vesca]|uniref:F-box/kelch-repeat protein At3g06240-like n=1 Tax=Fragaria vesca subsp. vesca TaxID=101020 RepID=UPI0002C37672|nr:PREDICTED: F-box/kelch-repeat protein At3g06240-like [Fragaria vesca subsp. vesca]
MARARALISGSLFAKKHLSHAAVTSRLQIIEYGSGEYEPETRVANNRELDLKVASRQQLHVPRWCSADIHSVNLAQTDTIFIVGSCNGLICLGVSRGLFLLWNPCTRETKMLPQLDTSWKSMFYGFGYDSAGEDYKVVVGALYERNIAVLSLKTGSWRIVEGLDEPVSLQGNIGCFFKGALHWLGFKEDDGVDSVEIISFDLAEEEFLAVLPLPISFPKTWWNSINCMCLWPNWYWDRD